MNGFVASMFVDDSRREARLVSCGSQTVWSDPAMSGEGLPAARRGRQSGDSDATIQTWRD